MANPNPSPETRWKPGQSGNPGGRRKRPDIEQLDKLIKEKGAERGIALKWLQKALDGDVAFFKLLIEYRNGKVPDELRMLDDDGTAKPRIEPVRSDRRSRRKNRREADSGDGGGGDAP